MIGQPLFPAWYIRNIKFRNYAKPLLETGGPSLNLRFAIGENMVFLTQKAVLCYMTCEVNFAVSSITMDNM
jgi:hypothetical protein